MIKPLLMRLVLALCLLFNASAFSIHPNQSRNPFTLQVSALDEQDSTLPDWIDRPRPRDDPQEYANVEIGIGRVAMIGFCGLLAGEIISGESFSQQILDALTISTSS